MVATPHQGHGYGREAAGTVVTWLRERGVGTLVAHVHPDHQASQGVARAVGFGLDPGRWTPKAWACSPRAEESGMAAGEQRRKFTPEFREEAVKLVLETGRPIAVVARDIGVVEGTLRNWVNLWRLEHVDEEPELSVSERTEPAQLRRDNQTLRMECEFLKKAAAFFATEQNR